MTTDLRDPSASRIPGRRAAPTLRRTASIGFMSAVLVALSSVSLTSAARGQEFTLGEDAPAVATTSTDPSSVVVPLPTATKDKILSSRQAALSQASRAGLAAGRFRTKAYGIAYAREWGKYSFRWSEDQTKCLATLWQSESSWRWNALNRRSGAYGIPQAKPGNKMASAGSDWKTNPETQIRWGMGYIKSRYETPCKALTAKNRKGWY
jgi:hypothetical protein